MGALPDDDPPCARPSLGRGNPHALAVHVDCEPAATIADPHPQAAEFFRQAGIDPEMILADVEAGMAALHEVDRARHGAEMDAPRRGAALDIGDVAFERLLEKRPGSRPIRPREDPGMHDPAQGGAVRCPLRVVIDDPRYRLMPEGIAEAAEEGPEFDGREQVEEHQRIGLFRGLVVIYAVPFRLEDPVEALDVAVFLPVA